MGGLTTLGLVFQISAEDGASPALAQVKSNVGQLAAGASADFESIGKSGVFAFESVQHKLIESTREMAQLRAAILETNDAAQKFELEGKLRAAQQRFTAVRTEMRGMRLEMVEATEKSHLLGDAIGIRIPAELDRVLARLPGFQSGLSKLFEVGILLAFVDVLEKIPEKIHELSDEVEGYTKAVQKAEEEDIEASQRTLTHFKTIEQGKTMIAETVRRLSDVSRESWLDRFNNQLQKTQTTLWGSINPLSIFTDGWGALKGATAEAADETVRLNRRLQEQQERMQELLKEQAKQDEEDTKKEEAAERQAEADEERTERLQEQAERKVAETQRKADEAERKREELLKKEEDEGLRASKEIQDLTLKLEGADPALIQYYNRLLEIQDAYGDTALAAQIATLATQVFVKEEQDKIDKLREETQKLFDDHGAKAEKPEVVEEHLAGFNRTLAEMKGHIATIHALYGPLTIQQLQANPAILANAKAWDEQYTSLKRLAEADPIHQLIAKFGALKVAQAELTTETIQGWGQMSSAIGGAAAHALVYGGNFGKAMREAAKSSLESLASQAIVKALFETGEGFALLAVQDYPDAELAFQSAAIFGAIGAVAGGLGRAIPGGGGGSRGGSGGSGGGGGGRYGRGGGDRYGGDGGSAVPLWASAAGQALTPAQRALAMGAPSDTVMIMGSRRAVAQQVLGLHNEAIANGGLPRQHPNAPYVAPGNGR